MTALTFPAPYILTRPKWLPSLRAPWIITSNGKWGIKSGGKWGLSDDGACSDCCVDCSGGCAHCPTCSPTGWDITVSGVDASACSCIVSTDPSATCDLYIVSLTADGSYSTSGSNCVWTLGSLNPGPGQVSDFRFDARQCVKANVSNCSPVGDCGGVGTFNCIMRVEITGSTTATVEIYDTIGSFPTKRIYVYQDLSAVVSNDCKRIDSTNQIGVCEYHDQTCAISADSFIATGGTITMEAA